MRCESQSPHLLPVCFLCLGLEVKVVSSQRSAPATCLPLSTLPLPSMTDSSLSSHEQKELLRPEVAFVTVYHRNRSIAYRELSKTVFTITNHFHTEWLGSTMWAEDNT